MSEPAVPTALLPAFAAKCAEWFPEMEGRFIAVSEVQPFDNTTNVALLPIGFVALMKCNGTQPNGGGNIALNDKILVHFAFKPVKYQNTEGLDTPFFAFYDYEPIRDKMLALTQQWRGPRNLGLLFKSMDVEATEFAVYIAFEFECQQKWCAPDEFMAAPVAIDIVARTMPPKSTVPCITPVPEPEDPCFPARKRNPYGRENWDDETKRQNERLEGEA